MSDSSENTASEGHPTDSASVSSPHVEDMETIEACKDESAAPVNVSSAGTRGQETDSSMGVEVTAQLSGLSAFSSVSSELKGFALHLLSTDETFRSSVCSLIGTSPDGQLAELKALIKVLVKYRVS